MVDLARQAGFAELYGLVEELHFRRQNQRCCLKDYGLQAQLKTLIHLIHRYGDRQVREGKPDQRILSDLKKASTHLNQIEPRGLLKTVPSTLHVSWPELLTAFGLVVGEQRLWSSLGSRLRPLENYLQMQRFLYFLFTRRLLRSPEEQRYKHVLEEWELDQLGQDRRGLSDWTKRVPLLPLQSQKLLLSPELLYDDLLVKYIELALFSENLQTTGHLYVAEQR